MNPAREFSERSWDHGKYNHHHFAIDLAHSLAGDHTQISLLKTWNWEMRVKNCWQFIKKKWELKFSFHSNSPSCCCCCCWEISISINASIEISICCVCQASSHRKRRKTLKERLSLHCISPTSSIINLTSVGCFFFVVVVLPSSSELRFHRRLGYIIIL